MSCFFLQMQKVHTQKPAEKPNARGAFKMGPSKTGMELAENGLQHTRGVEFEAAGGWFLTSLTDGQGRGCQF